MPADDDIRKCLILLFDCVHSCAPQTISRQLYEVNGFRGAKQNYYDPDNSCINKVRPV